MTPEDQALLKDHVERLTMSLQTIEHLKSEIEELRAVSPQRNCDPQRESRVHRKIHRLHSEMKPHMEWFQQVSLVRREVLLQQNRGQLEAMGLEYPEIPSFLREGG